MTFTRTAQYTISTTLLVLLTLAVSGCPKAVKQVQQAAQLVKDSPRPTGAKPTMHLVDQGDRLGFQHDLAVVDGWPVLVYRGPDGLRYTRATVPHPAADSDWVTHVVDPAERAGGNVQIVVIDGRPLLLYTSGSRDDRHFSFATADTPEPATADDWVITEFPADCGFAGAHDATIIDGRPAFLTFWKETKQAAYAYAGKTVPESAADWTCILITSDDIVMATARLAAFEDKPCIVAREDNLTPVLYAYFADSAQPTEPAAWRRETVRDPQGRYLSLSDSGLAVIAGQPAVAYHFDEPPVLNYAWRSVDSTGQASWQSSTVLNWQDYSSGLDLIELEGRPLIAYTFWAQAFAIQADSAAPDKPHDWAMSFVTEDVAKGDYRSCRAAYVDGKVVVSVFGFDTGQGEGIFFSIEE